MTPQEEIQRNEYLQRHANAAHAVQSGVAFELGTGSQSGSPKHLRTGVNMAMADQAGLVGLLIEKGIITDLEYCKAIAESAEAEKARYEQDLSNRFGKQITLG